jgi:hypothetical protein
MHAILHLASCVLLVGVEIEMKSEECDRDRVKRREIEDRRQYTLVDKQRQATSAICH